MFEGHEPNLQNLRTLCHPAHVNEGAGLNCVFDPAQELWFPPYVEPDAMILDAWARAGIADASEKMREGQRAVEERGRQAFRDGNAIGFLGSVPNTKGIVMVGRNRSLLRERGIYEAALLDAFTGTRSNNRHFALSLLRYLFSLADRTKLLAAGDPVPGRGPFTLYRGVAGKRRDRRVRGFSWTGAFENAAWFAARWPLEDPAVYKAEIEAKYVLAYVGSHRNEDEYIVDLPRSVKIERMDWTPGTEVGIAS